MELLGKISAHALKSTLKLCIQLTRHPKLVELQLFQSKLCGTKDEDSKKR